MTLPKIHPAMQEVTRAVYMLRAVRAFIDDHPGIGDYVAHYDDVTCDADCLAADCEAAANALEAVKL